MAVMTALSQPLVIFSLQPRPAIQFDQTLCEACAYDTRLFSAANDANDIFSQFRDANMAQQCLRAFYARRRLQRLLLPSLLLDHNGSTQHNSCMPNDGRPGTCVTCASPGGEICVYQKGQLPPDSSNCPTSLPLSLLLVPPTTGPPSTFTSDPNASSSAAGDSSVLVETTLTVSSTATFTVLTTRMSSSSTSAVIITLSDGQSSRSLSSNLAFTTPTTSPVLASSKHDIPVGTIVGSVLGAISLIMLLAIGLIFWRQRINRRRDEHDLTSASSPDPDPAFNERSFLYSDPSRYGYSQTGTSTPPPPGAPRRIPIPDVESNGMEALNGDSFGYTDDALAGSRPPSYPNLDYGSGRQAYGRQRASVGGSQRENDEEEEKYPEEKSPEMIRELERELQFRYD
uniref:Uncharacterized protein n=1 Tax=Mycena chlorophos TaxID=658473 RepID=A0ABQ0LTY9_MYCCL|nr:predicted protein [Mycena chlorophos]